MTLRTKGKFNLFTTLIHAGIATTMMAGLLSTQAFAANEEFVQDLRARINGIQPRDLQGNDVELFNQIIALVNSGRIEQSAEIEAMPRRKIFAGLDRSGLNTLQTAFDGLTALVNGVAVNQPTFSQRVRTKIARVRQNPEANTLCSHPLRQIEAIVNRPEVGQLQFPEEDATRILNLITYNYDILGEHINSALVDLNQVTEGLLADHTAQQLTQFRAALTPHFIAPLEESLTQLYALTLHPATVEDTEAADDAVWTLADVQKRSLRVAVGRLPQDVQIEGLENAERVQVEFAARRGMLFDQFLNLAAIGKHYGPTILELQQAHQTDARNGFIPAPQLQAIYETLLAAPELQIDAIRERHEAHLRALEEERLQARAALIHAQAEAVRIQREQVEQARIQAQMEAEQRLRQDIADLLAVTLESLEGQTQEQLTASMREALIGIHGERYRVRAARLDYAQAFLQLGLAKQHQ